MQSAGFGYTQTSSSGVSLGSYIDAAAEAGWFGTISNHPPYLYTKNGVTPQMMVGTDGRVGIGTTTPTARLTIAGSGAYNAAGAARLELANTAGGGSFLQHVTDTGLLQFATPQGATIMAMNSEANIGIKTLPDEGSFQGKATLRVATDAQRPFAVQVNGHIGQDLTMSGLIKALVVLNADGTMARCYNGKFGYKTDTPGTTNCGFVANRTSVGSYTIFFGFDVFNRFAVAHGTGSIAGVFYGPGAGPRSNYW